MSDDSGIKNPSLLGAINVCVPRGETVEAVAGLVFSATVKENARLRRAIEAAIDGLTRVGRPGADPEKQIAVVRDMLEAAIERRK